MHTEGTNMKKLISLGLFFIVLLVLSACGKDTLGEFPEVNENKKVDMTVEEMNTLLSAVDMQNQMEEAMLLSIDLDMNVEQGVINPLTRMKESDFIVDLVLSSKTYISLSDQIDEVALISNNTIDLSVKTEHVYASLMDEEDSIKGDLDIYFMQQFLYYNADIETTATDGPIENGKHTINLGVTQSIWDEIFVSPDDLVGDYLDIGIDPDEILDDVEMMTFMLESGMISAYKDGSAYTFMIDITKSKILDNLNDFLDATMDTTDWDSVDYFENSIELKDSINLFDKLELSLIYVVEDDVVQKAGISMNIELNEENMMVNIVGQIVIDMNVDMPDFPKDLDEYELTDSPLGLLGF
jgi:hypothetical protein